MMQKVLKNDFQNSKWLKGIKMEKVDRGSVRKIILIFFILLPTSLFVYLYFSIFNSHEHSSGSDTCS